MNRANNYVPQNIGFYIGVLYTKDNVDCIPNQLILDGLSDLYSVKTNPEPPGLNGEIAGFDIGTRGMLTTVNALHSDMIIDIEVQPPGIQNFMDDEDDTPYGFKLSQIMDNIGNINTIEPNVPCSNDVPAGNGWANIGNLSIVQQAFYIEECECRYAVFEFKIKNIGSAKARKILFKDIFPNGIHPKKEYIYARYDNGPFFKVKDKRYKLQDRRIILKVEDLRDGEEITIVIGCTLDKEICPVDSNVGAISWVGWQSCRNKDETLDESSAAIILTKLSNKKKLGGCTNGGEDLCNS